MKPLLGLRTAFYRAEDVPAVRGDFWFSSVRDPFGNVLGLLQNPHFVRGE